jgi:hypothetical protein
MLDFYKVASKGPQMGLTYIKARITNPASPRKSADLEFLMDSGAAYSVVSARIGGKFGSS